MKAVVVERNPLVCRKIERFFRCASFDVVATGDPSKVERHLESAHLLAADTYDVDLVIEALDRHRHLQSVLWTAEPMERTLRAVAEREAICNILGRPDFDTPPRGWELMMTLRRLARPQEEGPKFAWYLNWGFTGFQERVDSSVTRDKLVHKVERFVEQLGARKKVAEQLAEVAHELIMNAMYDAPADEHGRPKYAANRKQGLTLPESERPHFKLASDGTILAIQVTDPFGRLERRHVFGGLARGLSNGQMDTSHGGAGLGMTVIHNGTAATFFDVVAGVRSEVTGIFELDTTHRDFRLQPKSLHFFYR